MKISSYIHIVVHFFLQSFPEHPAVAGACHVGEDRVLEDGPHGVRVRSEAGARRHPEETVFRIDRAKSAFFVESHPSDIVAHALNFITGQGRLHHGQVGLAASTGERCGDVTLPTFRISDAQYLERVGSVVQRY